MKILRIVIAVIAMTLGTVANATATIIDLTFSGTYNIAIGSVFGESGLVTFHYSMTYNTSLYTYTTFIDTGALLGDRTTTHQWYGYSASGIIASDFTFGTHTFFPVDITSHSPAGAVIPLADLWFDTDISLAAPSLTWFSFDDLAGELALGGALDDGTNIFLRSGSSITELPSTTSAHTIALLTIEATGAPIPEPATIALLGIGLAGLAGVEVRRRRKRKHKK